MKQIGIIIRGKQSEAHEPDYMEMHADVVLSDGSPIGYFGENGGFSASAGMFMDGVVYDYTRMAAERPYYTNAETARSYGVVSTICLINVEDAAAQKFDQFWKDMSAPGRARENGFSLLGNNCSTNAAKAFRYAGIIDDGIPGLDTPQTLFTQLRSKLGGNFRCASGYVGFLKNGMQMKIQIERSK